MNKAKAKGTYWETRIVSYLRDHGFPYTERRALSGALDKGDVALPGVVIEAKNQRQINLAAWVDEMVKEKANAGVPIGVVCFPRRNKSTARAYVVMELEQFVEMIR